jgi:hypothetical protein
VLAPGFASSTEDVIPKLACRSSASGRSLIRLRVLCAPSDVLR